MSPVRNIAAIAVSDLHLSHTPPAARSGEPDWYLAMQKHTSELCYLTEMHKVPVICAGDIFDRWNSPPEVINWALSHLPHMYAVPGQHDLPYHRYEDRKKSAYWTLVQAGKITNLEPGNPVDIGFLRLHGFPWGIEVTPYSGRDICTNVAVIHSYIWKDRGSSYVGAPKSEHVQEWRSRLFGYDVAIFGDNHDGFMENVNGTTVLNCGGFLRRKMDETNRQCWIGMIRVDGSVFRHEIPKRGDIFLESEIIIPDEDGQHQFVEDLMSLTDRPVDFWEILNRRITEIERKEVKDLIVQVKEEVENKKG